MRADGGDPQALTTLPGKEESPDWQALPLPAPAPPGVPAALPPGPSAPASRAPGSAAAPRLTLRLRAGQTLRSVARRGLRRVRLVRPCVHRQARALLGTAQAGTGSRALRARATTTLVIKAGPRVRQRLARARRVTLTLRVTAADGARRSVLTRRVTLTPAAASLRP